MARKPVQTLDYLSGMKILSNTEIEFMEAIWNRPDGIMSSELYNKFPQALGTKTTIMHRIVEKGYIEAIQQGRHYIYKAKVTKKEYEQAVLKQKIKKAFGISSFETLIAAFCGRGKLTDSEEEKIRKLLEELENE